MSISGSAPSDIANILNKTKILAQRLHQGTTADRRPLLLELIDRIAITPTGIRIEIAPAGLRRILELTVPEKKEKPYILEIEAQLRRLGGERKLIIASEPSQTTDPYLIKAIVRAHRWFGMLKRHEVSSLTELAVHENIQRTYINSLLPLAFLPPKLTEAILDGKQPADLRLDELIKKAKSQMNWQCY